MEADFINDRRGKNLSPALPSREGSRAPILLPSLEGRAGERFFEVANQDKIHSGGTTDENIPFAT
jgi:hypothetical protein